jgi:predicted Fe-Mo cluster-binding NifX family protein
MAYRIAVGTLDGKEITEHFGRARGFRIFEVSPDTGEEVALVDIEVTAAEGDAGHNQKLLEEKIQALLDWKVTAILVKQIGPKAERMVIKNGIQVLCSDGSVTAAMEQVKRFYKKTVRQVLRA